MCAKEHVQMGMCPVCCRNRGVQEGWTGVRVAEGEVIGNKVGG